MKYIKKYEKVYDIDDLMENIKNINMTKKILSSGVDPNSYKHRKYPVIHLAAYYKDTHIMDLLLKYGANIDGINTSNGATTLIEFSANSNLNDPDDIKILYYIIDKGADWSLITYDGKDFMDALYYNNSSVTRFERTDKDKIIDDIIKRYPEKYKEYLIKKEANKYNL